MSTYLDQINAFHRLCESEPLSPGSQLLWFKLMDINNRLRWADWFQVTNRRLILLLDTNKNTLIRNRDALISRGLIEYQKGKKGQPSAYKMADVPSIIGFNIETEYVTETEIRSKKLTDSGTNNEPFPGPKEGHINRHKIQDTRHKTKDTSSSTKKHVQVDYDELLNLWNSHRGEMPAIKTMTDSRKRAVQGILNKFRKEDLFNVILKAEQSDFLNGRVKEFRASFDWILKPANFVKVLEDNYANRSKPAKTETPNNVYAQLYAEAVASGEDVYEDPFGLDEPLLPEPEIEEAEIE